MLVGKPPCAPLNDVIEVIAKFNDGDEYVIKNATVGDDGKFLKSSRNDIIAFIVLL